MITYRATLDVPPTTVATLSGWLQAHRRRVDVRPWHGRHRVGVRRCWLLRWLVDGADVDQLARDTGISQATGYRYLHEAIEVVAAHAPQLEDVLEAGRLAGWAFVALDGTLIETSRVSARSEAGHDLWYAGKHHHGANIQVVTDPTGFPVRTSPAEPGSVHDITAARVHCLGQLYPAAAAGLPTLVDKGYTGTGIGPGPTPRTQHRCRQPGHEPRDHRTP